MMIVQVALTLAALARSHPRDSHLVCAGSSCSTYVQASLNKHVEAIAHVDRHIRDRAWEACNRTLVEKEMSAAPAGDALARASAFLAGSHFTMLPV